jgi:hypothetical protein
MLTRRGPRSSGPGRMLRLHRLDRNPLRRWTDRAETAVLGILIAAFAVGAPLAASAAGSLAHGIAARQQQAQDAVAHQVTATLLQPAPVWSGETGALPTDARWRAPDGRVRTGPVDAPSGAAKGGVVPVWVDQSGQLTGPPLSAAEVAARVGLAEALTAGGLALALILAGWLARRALDRRRMAAWDADWLATGPRWTSRR